MSWNPFSEDLAVQQENQAVNAERAEHIALRMADLAKQLELYGSDNFAWFLRYLEKFKERVKNEAITIEDPIDHAGKRAEYRLLAFLIAIPHTTSLEYQALRDELETLRPEEAGTLSD